MSERDADFSPATITTISSRAGYRCAYAGCDQSTIGPGSGQDDVEKIGTAAHIYSSSTGSRAPRGTGGLTAEQRSSAANGIWLCRDHGTVIDNDKGKNYPASMLQAWKALHENRIAQELRKVSIGGNGWLEQITVEKSPLFVPGSVVTLGKVTLLFGPNGVGKTALCEWLAGAVGDTPMLERWALNGNFTREIALRLSILNPDRAEFAVTCSSREVNCNYKGIRAIDLMHALRIIYIRERTEQHFADDIEYLANVWGIHSYHVPQILRDTCSSKYGYIKDVEEEQGNDSTEAEEQLSEMPLQTGQNVTRLRFKVGSHQKSIAFGGLSSSERSQIIISGAMVIANQSALHEGTLLILELGGQILADNLLSAYADKLQAPDFRFQTLLVSPEVRPKVDWTGWSMASLSGSPPDVKISQD